MNFIAKSMQIRRIHKQHNSCIVTIPKTVMMSMRAKPGDYVMFNEIEQTGVFVVAKIHEGDYQSANDKGNSDTQNKGRRS